MRQADVTCPKIELHLHLDCSLSWDLVCRLRPGVTEAQYRREYMAPARCTDLAAFLACVPNLLALLQTREGLVAAVEDLFDQLAADQVIYAEIRFAPLLHTNDGLTPEQVVDTVDAAVRRMTVSSGIVARLILCTLRHYTEEQSLRTAALVHASRGTSVVALDIAGDEAGFPLRPHVAAFRYAHAHGLGTTAHAGEALGPPSVWETLRELTPDRIGHGIRCIEDETLVTHLATSGVHLEVCPSSNLQTMAPLVTFADHPVERLYAAGVSLGINTDTRTLTETTLRREYQLLHDHFRWTHRRFWKINQDALQHAFVDEATRQSLRARLDAAWNIVNS